MQVLRAVELKRSPHKQRTLRFGMRPCILFAYPADSSFQLSRGSHPDGRLNFLQGGWCSGPKLL